LVHKLLPLGTYGWQNLFFDMPWQGGFGSSWGYGPEAGHLSLHMEMLQSSSLDLQNMGTYQLMLKLPEVALDMWTCQLHWAGAL
jgi:hypothetical protein